MYKRTEAQTRVPWKVGTLGRGEPVVQPAVAHELGGCAYETHPAAAAVEQMEKAVAEDRGAVEAA